MVRACGRLYKSRGEAAVLRCLSLCAFLVNNIYRDLLTHALGAGADQGPDLLGNAALTADHLAHVLRGDTQLQRHLLVLDRKSVV